MTHSSTRPKSRPLGVLATLAVALLVGTGLAHSSDASARAGSATDSLGPPPILRDPPQPSQVIQPEALARALADTTAQPPAIFHVGFKVLFRGGHIPGSHYIGSATKPEGLAALNQALEKISRKQAVVLYCGCCPWADCPNVRPAYLAARKMGFKDVKVLFLPRDLRRDWIEKGFPVSKD